MTIRARLRNGQGRNEIELATDGSPRSLSIGAKRDGRGSEINGGELFLLALATCYCNDVYREAAKHGIEIEDVDVVVEGEFSRPGAPGNNIVYRPRVSSPASADEIRALLMHVDTVAEIHNTVRAGTEIRIDLP
jgi:organic hydroperoxide reductase OsmC/OhrA